MKKEVVNTKLNRVLILNKDDVLVDPATNYKIWMDMNLVLVVDTDTKKFQVKKNRWGDILDKLPLRLMSTFLLNPEITNATELEKLQ